MDVDRERIRRNARQSPTDELLDRVTVFRAGMEADALEIIEAELNRRGVGIDAIRAHQERRSDVRFDGDVAEKCSFCDKPAVARGVGWHRLWGKIPLFPRRFRFCEAHNRTRTS